MTVDAFEFDIAISFLARDEALAAELHSKLASRYNVFLYSKEQEMLGNI